MIAASTFRRRLRAKPTEAESTMWEELRDRRLGGYKFVRQVSLGDFTVDFLCRRRKLIVELDGPEHVGREEYDAKRTRWLNEQGYSVLRFGNREVLIERPRVLQTIVAVLEGGQSGSNTNYSPAMPPERVRE